MRETKPDKADGSIAFRTATRDEMMPIAESLGIPLYEFAESCFRLYQAVVALAPSAILRDVPALIEWLTGVLRPSSQDDEIARAFNAWRKAGKHNREWAEVLLLLTQMLKKDGFLG